MFKRCITKCGSTPDIQAFINEDGKLVVERSGPFISWICPYISRHLLSLNPLQARCRRYSRGER